MCLQAASCHFFLSDEHNAKGKWFSSVPTDTLYGTKPENGRARVVQPLQYEKCLVPGHIFVQ